MRRAVPVAILTAWSLLGCNPRAPDDVATPRPQQAGQPMDPIGIAGHMVGARVAAMAGNQQAVEQHMHAMSEDMRRAMKLADASRPIDREAARSVARGISGVLSANWIDRHNLLVRVDGASLHSQRTIDAVCLALEPLGDTLAVVVHLQDAAPKNRDGMDTLSRNCQLAPGDHALLQRPHKLDVLDPEVRAQHRASGARIDRHGPRQHTDGDRAALEAVPQM